MAKTVNVMGEKTKEAWSTQVEASLKLIRFALYYVLTDDARASAIRAGFDEKALNDGYLKWLVKKVHISGLVGQLEIPWEEFIVPQEQKSLAVMIWIRDNAQEEGLRYQAAKDVLALCGRTTKDAKPISSQRRILKLMEGWTEAERSYYVKTKRLPPSRTTAIVEDVQDQADNGKTFQKPLSPVKHIPVDEGDDRGMLA